MIDFLANHYLWLKAFHIIAVIAWMAGLFYLPRLFVYHAMTTPGSEASGYFLTMERKLLKIIMTPAMIAAFLSGGCLLLVPGLVDWSQGWMHAKLGLVFLLAFTHGMTALWRKEFVLEKRIHSPLFFRVVNEIPTVLMIIIVILVVLKPF